MVTGIGLMLIEIGLSLGGLGQTKDGGAGRRGEDAHLDINMRPVTGANILFECLPLARVGARVGQDAGSSSRRAESRLAGSSGGEVGVRASPRGIH